MSSVPPFVNGMMWLTSQAPSPDLFSSEMSDWRHSLHLAVKVSPNVAFHTLQMSLILSVLRRGRTAGWGAGVPEVNIDTIPVSEGEIEEALLIAACSTLDVVFASGSFA